MDKPRCRPCWSKVRPFDLVRKREGLNAEMDQHADPHFLNGKDSLPRYGQLPHLNASPR